MGTCSRAPSRWCDDPICVTNGCKLASKDGIPHECRGMTAGECFQERNGRYGICWCPCHHQKPQASLTSNDRLALLDEALRRIYNGAKSLEAREENPLECAQAIQQICDDALRGWKLSRPTWKPAEYPPSPAVETSISVDDPELGLFAGTTAAKEIERLKAAWDSSFRQAMDNGAEVQRLRGQLDAAEQHVRILQQRADELFHAGEREQRIPDETSDGSFQAPIAKLIVPDGVSGGAPLQVELYAPGLPPGEHDLYCEPPAPGGQKVPHPCFETKAIKSYEYAEGSGKPECIHCGIEPQFHRVAWLCTGSSKKTTVFHSVECATYQGSMNPPRDVPCTCGALKAGEPQYCEDCHGCHTGVCHGYGAGSEVNGPAVNNEEIK